MRILRRYALPFLACVVATTASGQDTGSGLKFTVASVKKSPADFTRPQQVEDSDGIRYVRINAGQLLMKAYGIQLHQLNGPSWLASEFFDITARSPAGASKGDVPAMLQGLLAERFHAAVHWEERPSDGYLLERDGDVRLQPCESGGCPRNGLITSPGSSTGVIVILANTLDGLATRLSNLLYQPVVDATGLAGTFHIQLPLRNPNFMAAPQEGRGDQLRIDNMVIDIPGSAPAPQDAVKALGLRLVRNKTTLKILKVDHIDQVPTEN